MQKTPTESTKISWYRDAHSDYFYVFEKNRNKCKNRTFYAILSIKALSEVPTFPPGGKHSQKMHFLCIKALSEVPTFPPGGKHSQKMHFFMYKSS